MASIDRTVAVPAVISVALVAILNLPAVQGVFADLDDWTHLETAVGIVRGDVEAWKHVLFANQGVAASRPLPYLLWAANYLLFGFEPTGYFVTNWLLHVGLAAAVFALGNRLGGPWVGAVAAVLVGLSGSSNQPVYYLSGRDDQLANLLFVLGMLAWQSGRTRWGARWGTVGIFVCGVLCKITALALPLILLVDDVLVDGRDALKPRRLLARYAPFVGVVLGAVVVLMISTGVSNPMALLTPEQRGGLAVGAGIDTFVARAAQGSLLPLFAKQGGVHTLFFELPRLAAFGVAFLGVLRWGALDGRVLLLGLAWTLVNFVMPYPFIVMDSYRVQDSGRYLQLPLIGFGLVVASLCGRRPLQDVGGLAGPAVILGTAIGFAAIVTPSLGRPHFDSRTLLRSLSAVSQDLPDGGRILVGVKRMDHGFTSLAASSLLFEMVPTLEEKPHWFLEGGDTLYRNTRVARSYEYGRYEVVDGDFDLSRVDTSKDQLLVDVMTPSGLDFARVVVPPEAFGGTTTQALPRWSFRDGDAQGWMWHGVPMAMFRTPLTDASRRRVEPPGRAGVGLELYSDQFLAPAVIHRMLQASPGRPPHLVSPPVAIEPHQACGLTIKLTLPDRVEPSYAESDFLVPSRRVALLGWSESEELGDPLERFVVLPLSEWPGPQTATVRLDNAPSWLSSGTVRRLFVVPANVRGPVDVHSLVFLPCTE